MRAAKGAAQGGPAWGRWAGLAALALLLLATSVQKIGIETDIWWQMCAGQWVLEHRAVPAVDEFSYTARGKEWIEIRWLFCVVAHLAWQVGGASLLIVGKTAVMAATFSAAAWSSRRVGLSPAGVTAIGLGLVAIEFRNVVRPEAATFFFVALFLALTDARSRGQIHRLAWILPAAQVAWTNSHGLFVLGPLIVWTYGACAVLAAVRRRRHGRGGGDGVGSAVRQWGLLAAAVTAACWVNPYGHRGAMLPLLLWSEIGQESRLKLASTELMTPAEMWGNWPYAYYATPLLALLGAASFVRAGQRTSLARLLLWAAFAYLTIKAARNAALFAVAGTFVVLRNLEERAADSDGGGQLATPRVRAAASAAAALAVAVAAWGIGSNRYNAAMQAPREVGLGILDAITPVRATEFLRAAAPRPNLFHSLIDGSYLMWQLRGRYPVFIDGRLEVYGEAFLVAYRDGPAWCREWEQRAERLGINAAMILREEFQPLAEVLRRSPRWALVYLDERSLIFVRRIAEHVELIRRFEIDVRREWRPAGPEPDDAPPAWLRWIGGTRRPWYSFGMAKSLLTAGAVAAAEPYLERAAALCPADRSIRLMLAACYASRGADAREALGNLALSLAERARLEAMTAEMVRLRRS